MSSQVDNASQALDRLAEVFGPRVPAKHASYLERVRNERIADLATVRQRLADQDTEIQRLREERDMARVGRDQALRDAKGRGVVQYELLDRAKAAEAEVQRLREERDEARKQSREASEMCSENCCPEPDEGGEA